VKKFLRKNWLGLLSIVISVGTWLSFWLRFSPFTWDSFGAMAATMGIIVAFLTGFQIWAVIDNKERDKELKNIVNEHKTYTQQQIDDLRESSNDLLDSYKDEIAEKTAYDEANFKGFQKFIFGELYGLANEVANSRAKKQNFDDLFFLYRLKTIQFLLKAEDYKLLKEVLINTLYTLLHHQVYIDNDNIKKYVRYISKWINEYGKEDEVTNLFVNLQNLLLNKLDSGI
jgi:hypothetical protein